MSTQRSNDPISEWQDGDSISGFVLLTKKERRQDRNGRDFIDLRLTDASGSMDGKIWGDSAALEGDFEAHDFVAVKGTVKSYRDRLQLTVHNCRVATVDDRKRGFDESRLVPSSLENLDDLWSRLQGIYEQKIVDSHLRRLAAETLAAHGESLREHPAAKSIHHAYRGGLLEHVVSMAELAVEVCRHYPDVSSDIVLVGVLFHDLGKTLELGKMPQNDYTAEGRLVGHVVIGRDLLRVRCEAIDEFPAELRLHLEHLILSHQGLLEYGSPVEPMTAEAIVLHAIDNLDAKLAQLREAAREGGGFQYLRGFGRYVLLAGGEGDDNAKAAAAEGPEQLRLDT
ncbi:MAG: HD domain-containing protein [Acidobacteriota bacterium]|nr:HD domain-containing protein [Acidobacteriota bacterium]